METSWRAKWLLVLCESAVLAVVVARNVAGQQIPEVAWTRGIGEPLSLVRVMSP